jgi:hypothetical protein
VRVSVLRRGRLAETQAEHAALLKGRRQRVFARFHHSLVQLPHRLFCSPAPILSDGEDVCCLALSAGRSAAAAAARAAAGWPGRGRRGGGGCGAAARRARVGRMASERGPSGGGARQGEGTAERATFSAAAARQRRSRGSSLLYHVLLPLNALGHLVLRAGARARIALRSEITPRSCCARCCNVEVSSVRERDSRHGSMQRAALAMALRDAPREACTCRRAGGSGAGQGRAVRPACLASALASRAR